MMIFIKKVVKLFLIMLGILAVAVISEALSKGQWGGVFLIVGCFVLFCYLVIGKIPWIWKSILRPSLPIAILLVVIMGVATFIFVQTPIGHEAIPKSVQVVLVGISSIWTAIKLVTKLSDDKS